ncbi:MAG: xanthine dehydrogenase small subunit [Alphaproteobacteria bacterium]|nr:xanthine dehydrogenase small subunit [Alphaproteobacteria bacterium]
MTPRPVRFLLNGRRVDITPDHADVTLLNWLRQDAQLTGSKEGCAEGDCGACSVLVARRQPDGRVTHDAANACILLLPMLDGMAVTTVEHVAGPKGELHPVQQAMVDHHGSQCGFCTPGFILSLLAGWRSGLAWQRPEIEDLIAGNLCRCTGYGPIITAAESLAAATPPEWELARIAAEYDFLEGHHAQRQAHGLLTSDHGQSFYAPDNLDDLADAIAASPDAQIIAGATDIGLWITKQHRHLPAFISVMAVEELNRIDEDDAGFTIGAGVSHHHAQQALREHFPQLDELWRRFGSRQVRATGTVCGNLANGSPIGDLAPAFLALGAELTLRHGASSRRLPLDAFFLGYMDNALAAGEFVQAVHLPKLDDRTRFRAIKISRRFDQDISAVMGAFALRHDNGVITEARVGFGGMAATPARASACEAALIGHAINSAPTERILTALDGDFTPISDVRASAGYRRAIARNLLIKALTDDAVSLAGAGVHSLGLEGITA